MSTQTITKEYLELALIFDHGLPERSILEDAIFEANLSEATLMSRNGVYFIVFSWDTSTDISMLDQFVNRLRHSHQSIQIRSAEPSNWVTSAEIARRLKRSRQSVQQWISGSRGPGNFPVPMAGLTTKTLIWNWLHVLQWLKYDESIQVEAHLKVALWVKSFIEKNG
jgi:hypothetical protein